MSHPLEAAKKPRGQRFMGPSISDVSIYRVPRRGRYIKGTEPIPLLTSTETLVNQANADTFDAGVRFYEKPPTSRNIREAWRGGLLATRLRLTKVLDDEGEPLSKKTDRGEFCLVEGIPNMGPKWIDIQRAIQPTKRRSR